MKKVNLYEEGKFADKGMSKLLVHDSPYFKILNFNFKAGQELPVHAHDIEGQVSLVVLEGEGEFLGQDGATLPAKKGDVLICRHRRAARTQGQNRFAAAGYHRPAHLILVLSKLCSVPPRNFSRQFLMGLRPTRKL